MMSRRFDELDEGQNTHITYRFVDMCTETKVAEAFRVFKFSSVLLDTDLV